MTANRRYSDEEFRSILTQRAHRFDLQPLVAVLARYGYRTEDVLFESNATQMSTTSLVAGIRFEGSAGRRAIITVNLGLLGAGGLLPNYFDAMIETLGAGESYRDFIRFFDHWLIANLLRVSFPELDRAQFADWRQTRRFYLRMLGVNTVSTLSWLFQLSFPELPVRVVAASIPSLDKSSIAAAGPRRRLDGSGVLGGAYVASSAGYDVTLVADDERDERGRPWLEVIRHRFEVLLRPMLDEHTMALRIELLVLEYDRFVDTSIIAAHPGSGTLASPMAPSLPNSRIGVERVRGFEGQPYRISIFSGVTGPVEEVGEVACF